MKGQQQFLRVRQVSEKDIEHASEKLSHLNLSQMNELMTRYYDGEKNSALIKDYQIDCTASRLFRLFPPVVTDTLCEHCENPIVSYRLSKSGAIQLLDNFLENPICSSCGHQPSTACSCSYCVERRKEETRRKREEKIRLVRETYNLDQLEPIPLEQLKIRDRVYLAALIRMGMDVNLEKTEPREKWVEKLSPTYDLDLKIIKYLADRKVIYPHPNSSIQAFTGNKENVYPNIYYLFQVGYHINVDVFLEDRRTAIEILSNPESSEWITLPDSDSLMDLWMELAVGEAEEYLKSRLKEIHLIQDKMPEKEKIRSNFSAILKEYSTATLWAIIYRAVKDGLHFKESKGIRSPEILVKFVAGRCQTIAERSIAERWNIKPFRRDYKLDPSVFARLLYNRILRVGEKGILTPPNWKGLDLAWDEITKEYESRQEAAGSEEKGTNTSISEEDQPF